MRNPSYGVEHKWGDYPCPEANCNYIAYCRTTLNKHARFHFTPKPKLSEFHCSKPNCKQSFKDICQKRIHEYIHDNVLTKCVFCPYTCADPAKITDHHRVHFNIRNYKCEGWGLHFV